MSKTKKEKIKGLALIMLGRPVCDLSNTNFDKLFECAFELGNKHKVKNIQDFVIDYIQNNIVGNNLAGVVSLGVVNLKQ